MGRRSLRLRLGIALATGVSLLAATASPAGAAVTIGHAGDSSDSACDANFDFFTGTSPFPFVVPGTGMITSWTMDPPATAGQQLTMKIFRKVAEPSIYQVVGHAGPQTLTPGGGTAGNTFPANVPVKPGDVLGLHTVSDESECAVLTPSATLFSALTAGDLADGASGPFTESPIGYVSVQATFVPSNTFTRAKTKRNKNKGTATVTLNLPNPGVLTGSGGGAKVAAGAVTSKTVTAGQAKLVIRAKGKKKATLNETGKVKVKPRITYTPTGGDPGSQKLKMKLLKR